MKAIKELRLKARLTQQELAEILNVRQSTVAMWEKGTVGPHASKLPAIAKALDCKIDELFEL